MTDSRLLDFFKESNRVPFDELPTVLMVASIKLAENTNLNTQVIYDNITVYKIPGYSRSKNKKIKIPDPGVPYSVLSAKCGREIKGIVKNLKDLETKTDGSGKFPNQISLDVSVPDRKNGGNKVTNVFIFKNSLKITGAQTEQHITDTCVFIKALLNMMSRKKDSDGNPLKIWDNSMIITKVDIVMENVVFKMGYNVLKNSLIELATNDSEIECPSDGNAVKVLYPTGQTKSNGDKKYFNFRVMHTGSVIFSGPNRKLMKPYYEKFMDFMETHESKIRFV